MLNQDCKVGFPIPVNIARHDKVTASVLGMEFASDSDMVKILAANEVEVLFAMLVAVGVEGEQIDVVSRRCRAAWKLLIHWLYYPLGRGRDICLHWLTASLIAGLTHRLKPF